MKPQPHFSSVELFSGCGGLALGLARSGFDHRLLVEFNECAVATLRHNRDRGIDHVSHWNLLQSDVRNVLWQNYRGVDLVAGGPPCQPFSIGGKAKGSADRRDMWPEVFRAVADIQPTAFIFENVRGITRPRFAEYLSHIQNTLSDPAEGLSYEVHSQLLNAADYGAAQKRFRLLVCGIRKSVGVRFSFPNPTHSRERLIWDQWVTGEYWRHHDLIKRDEDIPQGDLPLVRRLRNAMVEPAEKRWVTVRDRLKGLGTPNGDNNHSFQPGARAYPGHTGSLLDQPAKALKAGDHGVPGGENMMVLDDGTVRYFTLRECARLQGIPDEFVFPRSWTESMRQLGNAVPVELSEAVGSRVYQALLGTNREYSAAA